MTRSVNRRNFVTTSAIALLSRSRIAAAQTPLLDPPQLIDIGGRHLALTDKGRGNPAVVLEAGLTAAAVTWYKVLLGIASFTRVCAYDRANLGQSDAAPKPRTVVDALDDLETLLKRAAIPPPYILVGASFGGYITRLFAATKPELIAGMVLIDASHEDQAQKLAEILTEQQFERLMLTAPRNIEGMDLPATWNVMQTMGRLPDIPLIVLTAETNKPAPEDYPIDEMDQIWRELQNQLAAESTNNLHLYVKANHAIALDRPAVVVDAIQRVVEAVRTGQPIVAPEKQATPLARG